LFYCFDFLGGLSSSDDNSSNFATGGLEIGIVVGAVVSKKSSSLSGVLFFVWLSIVLFLGWLSTGKSSSLKSF